MPTKPVLLAVDDDPEVLRSVERDLRQRYADRYRVLRAESGQAALHILRQLVARAAPVALLLVDQRMPHMSGVEFLKEATGLYPDSKRVLLTAYADTDAAIRAINEAQVHHYLLKPWDPPEEQLYPVLDDLLDDWMSSYRPPFEGVRVLGHRWAPASYATKDFLARHHVPYRWFDVETAGNDPEVRRLLASVTGTDTGGPPPGTQGTPVEENLPAATLPMVVFSDGSKVSAPSSAVLAEKLGLRTRPETAFYDLLIVGGGPAGLAAAVYAASEGLHTVMIEREAPGGQAAASSRIENYLGFPSGLSGADLTRRAVIQARRFGVEILSPQEVTGLRTDGPYRIARLSDGSEISCHVLLIATGVQWRRLDVPGVERLQGAGVYYGAAMTEAVSCRDETVYLVGGANSAGQAAVHFARYAREVIMLVRGPSLSSTMSQYLIDQILATPNIQVRTNTSVKEAHGDNHLEALTLRCSTTGEETRVQASSLFLFIGAEPKTGWLGDAVLRDDRGFIPAGPDLLDADGKPRGGWSLERPPMLLETSMPGVFVAGDVRHGSVKRVASGVGEGAIAVSFIHQYLARV